MLTRWHSLKRALAATISSPSDRLLIDIHGMKDGVEDVILGLGRVLRGQRRMAQILALSFEGNGIHSAIGGGARRFAAEDDERWWHGRTK